MEVSFKTQVWRTYFVDKKKEEELLKAIENEEPITVDWLYENEIVYDNEFELETEVELDPYENAGQETIVVYKDDNEIWNNSII